ncbi:hypothetical protein ACH5RR_012566 [Cinchona calisaya]|uniref:Uncharacterized protein n=1 Tax=Cinchona calisaya TaxID=153742 RepID=A0ABD3ABQ1_9GENT
MEQSTCQSLILCYFSILGEQKLYLAHIFSACPPAVLPILASRCYGCRRECIEIERGGIGKKGGGDAGREWKGARSMPKESQSVEKGGDKMLTTTKEVPASITEELEMMDYTPARKKTPIHN